MAEPIKYILEVDDKGTMKLKKFGQEVQKMDRSVDKSMKNARASTDKLSKSFDKLGKAVKAIAIAWVASKIKNAFAELGKIVTKFERTFANVRTLINASPEEIAELRKGVLDLAGGMGTATQMTEALYQVISANIRGTEEAAQKLAFLELAGKAAAAGMASTFEAVDLGSTILNAFGESADEAGIMFSQIQETIRLGKTTFGELASTVGQAAPIFANAGLKSQDLLAAIATLTSEGQRTDIAITGLRQTVASMINPTAEAAKLWKEYGFENIRATLASQGLQKTLALIKEKVGETNPDLNLLFGNIRAFTAVAPLAGGAAEKYAESLEAIEKNTNSLNEAFEKVSDTFEYQWAEAIETLRSALIDSLLPTLKELAQWLKENKQTISDLAEIMKFFAGTIGKVVIQQLKAKEAWKSSARFQGEVYKVLKESKLSWWEIAKALLTSKDATEKNLGVTGQLGALLIENTTRAKGFAGAIIGVGGATDKLSEALDKLDKAWDKKLTTVEQTKAEYKLLKEKFDAAAASGLYTAESLKALEEAMNAAFIAAQNLNPELAKLAQEDEKLMQLYFGMEFDLDKETDKLRQQIEARKQMKLDAAKKEMALIETAYGEEENLMDKLIEEEKKKLEYSTNSWKNWADNIMGFFGNIWSSIQGTYEQFNKVFTDLGKIRSEAPEGTSGGGIFMKMLPGIGKLAGLLLELPKIIKQVWASIKNFATSIAKLFGWMSEEEKVQKDVLRDLGTEISDELAKKIADASKEIGDRFTAVTLHLGDIMRETDITADNFDTFASRARDIFSLLETGMISSAEATETLNDVFGQLAEEADKLGITFNKNMIDMIRLSQQFGLEVEAISEYVEEKLGVAIKGLTRATQDLGEVSQEEFDRLARAAAATFNALMQSGVDVADTVEKMKEIISNLNTAYEENGLKGSAAFNQLKRYANLVEANQAVIESVKGMTDVYTALTQVGAMNQKLFNDWQQETITNYDKLIEGGFKQNEALSFMAPTLQALKDAHETMGLELDENTKKLIEQAEAAGLLKPDPIEMMTDAVEKMTDAIDRLIDYMSGNSPPCGSLTEAIQKVESYMQSMKGQVENTFDPSPIEKFIGKMGEIPRDIDVNVGYNYEDYGRPGGGGGAGPGRFYQMQHGGMIDNPTHILVGENPNYRPEWVLNRPQMQKVLGAVLSGGPRPARDLSGGDNEDKPIVIRNEIILDGKVIAKNMKKRSRDGTLEIDARSVQ